MQEDDWHPNVSIGDMTEMNNEYCDNIITALWDSTINRVGQGLLHGKFCSTFILF